MIGVVSNYLLFLLIMQPVEEIYNCNHPNLVGTQRYHALCDWEEDDFYTNIKGKKILRPKRKKDNRIKAHYRKKYWSEMQWTL